MTGYSLIAIAICLLALVIYIIWKKIKNGVSNFFTIGLQPYGEFAELILTLGERINKKRKEEAEFNPRNFIGDERWLLDSQGPKTFYFIDESQVNDMFSQINQKSLLEYSESEKLTTGIEGGISSTPITAKGNKGSAHEKTSKFLIDNSVAGKYNHIENYLKDNQLIQYGIAQFYTDEFQREKFNESCKSLETDFKFKITEADRDKHWITLNKENAYPTLEMIKSTTGNIAIQQDFSIEETNGQIKLYFSHPINAYLEEKDKEVKICISCFQEKLTTSGMNFIKNGKTIKATCIGKIIRWDEINKTLEINPISIF
jgi:hypothetical protein